MARILATIGILCLASCAATTAAACAKTQDLMQRPAGELPAAAVAVVEDDAAEGIEIGIAQRTGAAAPAGRSAEDGR